MPVIRYLTISTITRKMVPIAGRASSFLEKNCMCIKRLEFSKTKDESLRRTKNDKQVKMKDGLGWIRGLRGQKQDMNSLAL